MDTSKLEQPPPSGSLGRAGNRGSPRRALSGPLLSRNEYEAYVEELQRLHEIRDRDLPGLLRDARTFVASDVAEEVIQIREDLAVLGARIRKLEELLHSAVVVEPEPAPNVVSLGRSVEVEYLRTGKVTTYRIVGIPASSGSGTVSAASPIGAALIGRSPGDVVYVELPHGRTENLRVLAVLDDRRAG